MASLQIFKIKGLKQENLINIKDYVSINEKEEEFDVELKQYITD